MDNKKKADLRKRRKIIVVLLCVSIVAIIIGVVLIMLGHKKNKQAVTIKAIIVSMDKEGYHTQYGSGTSHITYVAYIYNGKEYHNVRYDEKYKSSWEIGDELTLKIQPSEPSKIHSDISSIGMGLFISLAGLSFLIITILAIRIIGLSNLRNCMLD